MKKAKIISLIVASVLMVSLAGTFQKAAAAQSNELQIVEVRRNIPLSDEELPVKDFYLAGADVSSLKKDQLITVDRKMIFKDATGNQTLGELMIPVGQLKVIFVSSQMVVARQHKIFSRNELPMLEQQGLMIGDLVDLQDKGNYK